jgi:hypothetical protein
MTDAELLAELRRRVRSFVDGETALPGLREWREENYHRIATAGESAQELDEEFVYALEYHVLVGTTVDEFRAALRAALAARDG